MKRALVLLGAVFAITGITLCVLTFLPVSGSYNWFNQSFVVPENSHYYVPNSGTYGLFDVTLITISFETTQGGDVDFYIMNEAEYNKFSSGLSFNYIQSAPNVTRMEETWDPPEHTNLYFVWDNTDLFETKSVSALFRLEYNVAVISPTIATLGLVSLFGGLTIISLGYRFPSPDSSRTKIIAGYVFAALGGVIGFFTGLFLWDGGDTPNVEDKFHGKVIMAIGIVTIATYVSIYYLIAMQMSQV